MKRGKPNTFRIKPSPMKIENSTPDGRKTTRIKISFREGQLQSPRVHIKVRILTTFYILGLILETEAEKVEETKKILLYPKLELGLASSFRNVAPVEKEISVILYMSRNNS